MSHEIVMPNLGFDSQESRLIEWLKRPEDAFERARTGVGPTFIELKTYRYRGHSRTDMNPYRPDGELEQWVEAIQSAIRDIVQN